MGAAAKEQRTGRVKLWARVRDFFRDSWLELQRVVWPTQQDVVKMTGLVLAVVFIVGIFIFLWDRILWQMTKPLFR